MLKKYSKGIKTRRMLIFTLLTLRFFFSQSKEGFTFETVRCSSRNAFSTVGFIYSPIDCKGLQGSYIDNACILNPIYAIFHEQLSK